MARPDFQSEDYMRDPFPLMAQLRREGALVKAQFPIVGTVWLATTHSAAARVLKSPADFSIRNDKGRLAAMRWWLPPSFKALAVNMLAFDDPDHARLRGIVDGAFHRREVLAMEPRLIEIARRLADRLFEKGTPADLVHAYARMLPLAAICELLGLPEADHGFFMDQARRATSFSGAISLLRLLPAVWAIRRYLIKRINAAKAAGGEGLIGELLRAQASGAPISDDEVVAMVFLLLMAGQETTTHLISGAVLMCLERPWLREILAGDPAQANLAIEEFLRFLSPVQFSKPRHARRDIEIDGVRLKKGERVMAYLASANADPAANDAPERFDPARHPNRHIEFGTGPHFCLGHQLARIEARVALSVLFTRWPGLKLAVEPDAVRWRKRPGLRAPAELPAKSA